MAKAKKRVADAQESLETWEGKRQDFAQEGAKRATAEKAVTEDRTKDGTKKSAKTAGAGRRRHDHRRDR